MRSADENSIELAQDKVQWPVLVNSVIRLRVVCIEFLDQLGIYHVMKEISVSLTWLLPSICYTRRDGYDLTSRH